jgi:hypothetical protein
MVCNHFSVAQKVLSGVYSFLVLTVGVWKQQPQQTVYFGGFTTTVG